MRKNRGKIAAVFLSVMMVVLTACGNGNSDVQATVAPVVDEAEESENEVVVEEEEEEPEKEEEAEPKETETKETLIPYYEENELEFCEDLTIPVKSVRIDINDKSVYEEVDAECVIKDVSIEEAEDEFKTITIKYEVTGEIYDSYERRFLQTIMPNAIYCDLNTGEVQEIGGTLFDNEETTEYTFEWNDRTYEITQTRILEWSPNSKLDWRSDGKNGYVTPVTLYVTESLVVPKDYDSLGMIIGMSTAEETYSGNYEMFKDNQPLILDILECRENAHLYSINEFCKLFSEDEAVTDDADTKVNTDNSSTASSNNDNSKENANNSSSKDSTTPKQEQPVHTHSYTSSVTKNPSCGENGVMTYNCSCGSSYTEAIPASGHQWVTTTETVSHPSTGHYENVTKKEIWCSCGARGFQSMAEYNAHAENCLAFGSGVTEWTENVWVVDSEGWTETINITKCSVCGAQG